MEILNKNRKLLPKDWDSTPQYSTFPYKDRRNPLQFLIGLPSPCIIWSKDYTVHRVFEFSPIPLPAKIPDKNPTWNFHNNKSEK